MRLAYELKRLTDVARSLIASNRIRARGQWTREELLDFQRDRLSVLVESARRRSAFYRELYAGVNPKNGIDLAALPIINKKTMMQNFDRFVTDPRLTLAGLQGHIQRLKRDEYFLGQYRVFTTSGSSGLKGVFVSNRREWSAALIGYFRCASLMGLSARFPNRWRIASVGGNSPMHVTYRMAASTDIGLHKTLRLAATSTIEDIVEALNTFQPDALVAYASVAALLAVEQSQGRLRIHPHTISTTAEVCTRQMKNRIQDAWGVRPFNNYGMTEAGILLGSDCALHRGIHIFEDLVIAEVADADNTPVPDGSPGQKLLITNLFNTTQPLIRYEVSDMVTVSPELCPCGLPFRLIAQMDGRSDDIIYLQDQSGREIPVHPVHFHSAIGAIPEISEYQIVHEHDEIRVRVVLRAGACREEVANRLKSKVRSSVESLAALCPDISIEFLERIERDHRSMGKLKLVTSSVPAGGLGH